MTQKAPDLPPSPQPALRQYNRVCLLSLLVMLPLLLELGLGEWSLVVVALGCICLLLELSFGPLLFLISLLWLLLAQGRGLHPLYLIASPLRGLQPVAGPAQATLPALALAVPVLVYLVGSYRLLALNNTLFPIKPKRQRSFRSFRLSRTEAPPRERRPVQAVQPREFPLLVVSALVWAVLAWLFWEWLKTQKPLPRFHPAGWRSLLLIWLSGMGLMLTSALLAYLSQALAGAEASAIALQDELWLQTRREQSRLNRWLVAARLRRQRKEER